MLRKLLFGIMALSLCMTFAANVNAQAAVTTNAVALQVGGDLEVTPLYRSTELAQASGSSAASESFTNVHYNVGLHAQASENISAVLEFENKHLNAAGAFVNTLDGMTAGNVDVGLAYVKVDEFLNPAMDLTFGIFDLAFDLRGNDQAFLLDLTPGSLAGDVIGDTGGWMVDYAVNPQADLKVFWLKLVETQSAHKDNDLYGLHLVYRLNGHTDAMKKLINVNVVAQGVRTAGVPGNHLVYTIGGGADYYLNEALELYGEVYFQAGETTNTVDQSAYALYVGAKYSVNNYYVDGSIWYLTGDETASADNETFMYYPGYHYAAILEDPVYGLNMKTNILALKIDAGYETQCMGDPMTLGAFLGNYTMQEDNGGKDGIGTELDVTATWNVNPSLSFQLGLAYLFGSDVVEAATAPAEDNASMLWLNSAFTF